MAKTQTKTKSNRKQKKVQNNKGKTKKIDKVQNEKSKRVKLKKTFKSTEEKVKEIRFKMAKNYKNKDLVNIQELLVNPENGSTSENKINNKDYKEIAEKIYEDFKNKKNRFANIIFSKEAFAYLQQKLTLSS